MDQGTQCAVIQMARKRRCRGMTSLYHRPWEDRREEEETGRDTKMKGKQQNLEKKKKKNSREKQKEVK